MKSKVCGVIGFVLGASTGAVVTWKVLKEYYERLTQEELDSIRASFATKEPVTTEEATHAAVRAESMDESHRKPTIMEYAAIAQRERYSDNKQISEEDTDVKKDTPYVITPEQFNDSEYETISLTLYADGVLETFNGDVVEDIEEMVGPDALKDFGVYEDDAVYVCDDVKRVCYEILFDESNHDDNSQDRPPEEDEE